MTTPDSADIPKDAASFSMNLRADASDGRLQGIQNDKYILLPYTQSDQTFVECAASNQVIEIITSGFDMVDNQDVLSGTTSANCGIAMFSAPASDVVWTITSSCTTTDWVEGGIDVSTSSLTFTASNYATVQNITFTAGNAHFQNLGRLSREIKFKAASSDSNWNNKIILHEIFYSSEHSVGFDVKFGDLIVDEADSSDTGSLQVRLRSRPEALVQIEATMPNYVDNEVDNGWNWSVNTASWTDTKITTDTSYWNTWKTISFNAVADDNWYGSGSYSGYLQLTASSSDNSYDGDMVNTGTFFYAGQAQSDNVMNKNYALGEQLLSSIGIKIKQDPADEPSGGDDGDTGGTTITCFEGWTKISTPDGDIPIHDLEEGQEVYSWNKKKGKIVTNKVSKLLNHFDLKDGYEVYKVTFNDGDFILATASHMYWNEEHARYLQIENFNEGDRLRTDVGFFKTIKSNVIWKKDLTQVYNFHTEKAPHNYFANSVLVHNGGGEEVLNNLFFILKRVGLMGSFFPIQMIHNPGGGGKIIKPSNPTESGGTTSGA